MNENGHQIDDFEVVLIHLFYKLKFNFSLIFIGGVSQFNNLHQFPCKARLGNSQNPINTQSPNFPISFFPSSRRTVNPFHSSHHFFPSLVSLSTPHFTFPPLSLYACLVAIIAFPKRIFPFCLFLGFLFFGNLTKKNCIFPWPFYWIYFGVLRLIKLEIALWRLIDDQSRFFLPVVGARFLGMILFLSLFLFPLFLITQKGISYMIGFVLFLMRRLLCDLASNLFNVLFCLVMIG